MGASNSTYSFRAFMFVCPSVVCDIFATQASIGIDVSPPDLPKISTPCQETIYRDFQNTNAGMENFLLQEKKSLS